MICRITRDGSYTVIGLTKSEINKMLKNPDQCAHINHPKAGSIMIYVVKGKDQRALEEEFLRIVARNTTPEKGAKPQ
jgi:hypothetical protein